MVTRAAKDLLRNTIRTVDHHNRLLEEQEMWRQWELEQGLTMMVSDDTIRLREAKRKAENSKEEMDRIKKRKKIEKYRRQCDSNKDCEKKHNYWMKKLMEVEEQDPDRWGHGGYKSLYPEEFDRASSKKQKTSKQGTNGSHIKKKKRRSRGKVKKTSKSKRSVSSHSQSSSSSDSASSSSSLSLHCNRTKDLSASGSDSDYKLQLNNTENQATSSNHCRKHSNHHHHHHHHHHSHCHRHQKRHRHSKDICRKNRTELNKKDHKVETNCKEVSSSDISDGSVLVIYKRFPDNSREERQHD